MPRSTDDQKRPRVGILVFDGVKMLDLVGPAEVFHEASQRSAGYDIVLISVSGADVTSSMGVRVGVHASVAAIEELDTLVVPGSENAPEVFTDDVLDAVRTLADRSRRVASICTAAFAVAAVGLLDGRTTTTHWKFADTLQAAFPEIAVEKDAIFVQDGRFHSSAGVAAGIDLALALLEQDYGSDVARSVAQLLLVYMKRSGSQSQFSASLAGNPARSPISRSVTEYVHANPTRPHSVRELASHVNVSPRHLTRIMREELDATPSEYVGSIRLDLAVSELESGTSVAGAAAATGYSSPVSFRRAFVRRFGITPSEYQRRFRTSRPVA
ncbi:GlxA family transcriptional regulator [Leifsonia sp. 21MFCrub1.1]|uniref:GlxA family transcriptional regulator n=1 Tax=Leifsonia sp. 21MFCrub1.1 TaxID=1798223 RepID=UPI000892A041|nr:GlxA family transcriptional regulator [Leifsonia sp. 21MFCrub1.1]SEB14292.1 Transcriptional regulator GlxA family, contains an amidase domain and an AraC-type DNA-binding HTH domain [Leifsonia sp. 21MFCrub1.1]